MWKIIIFVFFFTSYCQSYGNFYWRDFEGTIPDDAFIAHATDDGPVYIATVLTDRVICAGELRPGDTGIKTFFNPVNSSSVALKILSSSKPENLVWKPTDTSTFNNDIIGTYPVIGGTKNIGRRDFFIGRLPDGYIGVIDYDSTIGLMNSTWISGNFSVLVEVGKNYL